MLNTRNYGFITRHILYGDTSTLNKVLKIIHIIQYSTKSYTYVSVSRK